MALLTKDIRLEGFDVAFGEKVLLKNADMTLTYGRRYGMVGRNGLGKSTLLRMMSSRQLVLPGIIFYFFLNKRYLLLSFPLPQSILLHINSEALPITYSVCCVFFRIS